MLFNSVHFILFFPVVILLYYIIPHKYRWVMLTIASYYFYMSWKAEYAILILGSTVIDYYLSHRIYKANKKTTKKLLLIISLVSNLGILFLFKYFNFFNENIRLILNHYNIFYDMPEYNLLLPVGISFYTFQTLSYTIEVYRGDQKPEKHFGIFALYVSFFPQLVAGPIERFSRLGPQFREKIKLTYSNLANGLRLMLYGYAIKMVIADNISVYVDKIFAQPEIYNSWSILIGMFFYSFQIYSDFYGYSLIAIGTSLIMGIKLMDNFKTPYLSKNIAEFWSRWHISLSTWFRDYLYISLGGNRVKVYRVYINLLIVFIVSGLWHGAAWTFVIWGAIHGFILVFEKMLSQLFKFKLKENKFTVTFLFLKTFIIATAAWVFFRAQSFNEAIQMFKSVNNNWRIENNIDIPTKIYIILSVFIISDIVLYNTRIDKWIDKNNIVVRWFVYFILLFAIFTLSGIDNNPFIYFQF